MWVNHEILIAQQGFCSGAQKAAPAEKRRYANKKARKEI